MWFLAAALAAPTVKGLVSYPAGGSGDPTCVAYIFSAPLLKKKEFQPLRVMTRGCPPEFSREVQKALRKWRWAEDEPQHLERWEIQFRATKPQAKVVFSETLRGFEDHVAVKHRSELAVTRAVDAAFPGIAEEDSAMCKGSVMVRAETGRVENVEVTGCSDVFHSNTVEALSHWEFEPVDISQDWIQTIIPIKFQRPVPPEPLELDSERFAQVLTVSDREQPWFPTGGQKFSPATCDAIVSIDAEADVTGVEVTGCDELFHVAVANAVGRWSWSFVSDPQPVRVALSLVFDKKNKRKISKRKKAK